MRNLKQGGTTNTKTKTMKSDTSSMKNKQTKNKIPAGDRIQRSQFKKKTIARSRESEFRDRQNIQLVFVEEKVGRKVNAKKLNIKC